MNISHDSYVNIFLGSRGSARTYKKQKNAGIFCAGCIRNGKMDHVSVIRPNGMIFHQPRFP